MTSTRKAVTPRPKTIVAAIGMRNCAWSDVSNIRADNPPIVVRDVSKTGLNLSTTPLIIASFIILSSLYSLSF
jgi:hypothetical protein